MANQFYNYPYFPMPQNFQQQSFNPQPQLQSIPPQNQNSSINSSINWVQGDIGARAFYVAPGTSAILMDSEGQNFYIKSADVSGMPMLKKYAYTEIVDEPLKLESHDNANNIDTAYQATREEVKQLHEEIKELKDKLANMEVENRNLQEQATTKTGGRKNA